MNDRWLFCYLADHSTKLSPANYSLFLFDAEELRRVSCADFVLQCQVSSNSDLASWMIADLGPERAHLEATRILLKAGWESVGIFGHPAQLGSPVLTFRRLWDGRSDPFAPQRLDTPGVCA
jgi:hypothetical protein